MSEESSTTAPLLATPWWTSPAGINFGFLIPIMLLITWAGESSFAGLTIRGIRFLTPYYAVLGFGVLFVTGLAGWIGSHVAMGRPADWSKQSDWDRPLLFIGALALVAYVIWFKPYLVNPGMLIRALTGAYHPDRSDNNIQLTTGVTSFVNVAPAFYSIYAYRWIAVRTHVSRTTHVMAVVLTLFTLFRVYAWSERLAMIEAAVPFGLALGVVLARRTGALAQFFLRLGPIFAIPVLILYFAGFEYVRSWQSSTYNKHYGFWEFAVGRLVSYYYTSLNNGAGMLATAVWPTYKFENTLNWLHKAPFVGPVFSKFVGFEYSPFTFFLEKYGDGEFNNPSGIYGVFFDMGLPYGFVYFAVIAFWGGVLYRGYRSSSLAGVTLYPIFLIAFLEVFRTSYLGGSHSFMWTLGLLAALMIKKLQPRSGQHSRSIGANLSNAQ